LYFDSHAHLDDARFAPDREQVIANMAAAGVEGAITVGEGMDESRAAVELAERHEQIWAVVGVHPHEAKAYMPDDIARISAWLKRPRVKAWGEMGLDYHYDFSPRDVQRRAFADQLDAACALRIPVVLHVREAHGDCFDMLCERKGRLPRALLHCYSGSPEMAGRYLDLGCFISLAGPVTFHNAANQRQVAAYVPLNRLMAETDCPYLAPVPHRGGRNEPAYVACVAEAIAACRAEPREETLAALVFSARAFFGLEAP
jgi:TatD DNase family protein